MTTKVNKTPLDFTEYQNYEIPHDYMAFVLEFTDVTQIECDDIEYDYHINGYKIFATEITRSYADRFNYKMIVAKASMTFQK